MDGRRIFARDAVGAAARLLREAGGINWELIKIMLPIAAAIRLLEPTPVIGWIGQAFAPLMELLGLPGPMGVVWTATLLTNLYGGMAAFAALAPAEALTTAQATVITTMMIVAHALPVELRIAQKAGARLRMIGLIRFGGAIVFGWILHTLFRLTGFGAEPCVILWKPDKPPAATWGAWAWEQAVMVASIFAIILTLLVLLRLLKRAGVIDALTRLLAPALRPLGMRGEAAPLTIIGMTMGLTYGGGLIIAEARSGRLSGRDVFFSMALMGLCHSLIEDTALMAALGGHVAGVLVGRLVLSLLTVFLLARLLAKTPERTFRRLFLRTRPTDAQTAEAAGEADPEAAD